MGWIGSLLVAIAKIFKVFFGMDKPETVEVIDVESPKSLRPSRSTVMRELGLRKFGSADKDQARDNPSGEADPTAGEQEDKGPNT